MSRRSHGTSRNKLFLAGLEIKPAMLLLLITVFACASAHAQVTLLLEEPYGEFGSLNPTGHAAIYLQRVCADTPTHLRRCRPGELGVVVSRYHRVDGYDWLAIPLLPYLYAVDRLDEVPAEADAATAERLRNEWRMKHLEYYAPDVAGHDEVADGDTPPPGEWIQLVGEAYDRRMYGYRLASTVAQDDAFIAAWNDRKNIAHFNLLFNNCADFARKVLDFYYPHAVHRNWIADAGMTTPKQVARCVTRYGQRHPGLHLEMFVVPQVPGSIKRSQRVDGAAEAIVKTKKYIIPLALVHPYFAGSLVVAWATEGRYSPPEEAPLMAELKAPDTQKLRDRLTMKPAATGHPIPSAAAEPGGL